MTVFGFHLQNAIAERRARVVLPHALGFADVSVAIDHNARSAHHVLHEVCADSHSRRATMHSGSVQRCGPIIERRLNHNDDDA